MEGKGRVHVTRQQREGGGGDIFYLLEELKKSCSTLPAVLSACASVCMCTHECVCVEGGGGAGEADIAWIAVPITTFKKSWIFPCIYVWVTWACGGWREEGTEKRMFQSCSCPAPARLHLESDLARDRSNRRQVPFPHT